MLQTAVAVLAMAQIFEGRMMSLDKFEMLKGIEAAVLSAAKYLLDQIANPSAIEMWHKKDKSLVMTLDIESQRIISESLGNALPIVGEEDEKSHGFLATAQDYFLIDPVDGTASCKRFLHREAGQLGFGPLVGFVEGGKLAAACFYRVPSRELFSAVRGGGAYLCEFDPSVKGAILPALSERQPLKIDQECLLNEAGLLFYPSVRGECRVVEYLKGNNLIENAYRFGGFANDCVRLACGLEQIQVQYAVKSWDFSASLIAAEAGLKVVVDPLKSRVDLYDWVVQPENPVVSSVPCLMEKILDAVDKTLPKKA